MMVARGFCLFNKCYRGNFEGNLQYHEVPQVETLSAPTKVGPVFKGDIPHVEAGVRAASPVRGSGVVSGQVVSRRRSAAADSALEEDDAYVAVGIERGKQLAQVWSAGSGPGSCDPDAAERFVDVIHAAIRDFAKTGFVTYLHLGELSLANLRQLCSEEEELVSDGGADGAASTQPRQG
ncbi:unnamed protein product [Lactuca virosa]|uniref:Uncharacterized protein n=1 Tax=Lactuca virosa TaxID=75947 RepID=A0AAU9PKW0_9ASTR|nr:unnamed protein product [Lactuca virosa]